MKILRNSRQDDGLALRRGSRFAAGLLLAMAGCALGQAASPLAVPAKQWAIDAAKNELSIVDYGRVYLRYRMHTVDRKGDETREIIESKDGPVARLVLKDGHPLTAEVDQWERGRLQEILDSPSAYFKHVKNEMNNKKMGAELVKLAPDAMLYSYAPGQPQREGRPPGAPAEIVVDYEPNPAWTSPSMTADALTGVKGRAWIDPRSHCITRMEGTVFRGINFGLGFLAHIYPGGMLWFEQAPAADNRWVFTKFVQRVNVRALLVKQIKDDSEAESSDFRTVKQMSYQEAVKLLLSEPLPGH